MALVRRTDQATDIAQVAAAAPPTQANVRELSRASSRTGAGFRNRILRDCRRKNVRQRICRPRATVRRFCRSAWESFLIYVLFPRLIEQGSFEKKLDAGCFPTPTSVRTGRESWCNPCSPDLSLMLASRTLSPAVATRGISYTSLRLSVVDFAAFTGDFGHLPAEVHPRPSVPNAGILLPAPWLAVVPVRNSRPGFCRWFNPGAGANHSS